MNILVANKRSNSNASYQSARDHRPKLIIFDCDGVLVQSEEITLTLLAKMLEVHRGPSVPNCRYLETSGFIERFRGRKLADCLSEIETDLEITLENDFEEKFRQASLIILREKLKPTDGIVNVLEEVAIQFCVASSAPRQKIEHCLRVTGLLPYFDGNIFSCYEIGAWKPDPSIFLAACKYYQVETCEALVIEDSVSGVRAAVAAGIRVLGFGPYERHLVLADAGALPFTHMDELLAVLR
ncbi:HAD-IA family hydrolase [Pseudomonas sp. KU26590]|uniref:HAD family hydrolase n=1 Tax=Pseudomonas sp. KU26590 TaxID=2991051 RepID=UPI00223C99D8|nr:HAD-IA family hydrolase [Pseudomonas sp. KU26590]UZJ58011.1 HAD-IA family hydrolase [Pseudomonas sp. KU26590]